MKYSLFAAVALGSLAVSGFSISAIKRSDGAVAYVVVNGQVVARPSKNPLPSPPPPSLNGAIAIAESGGDPSNSGNQADSLKVVANAASLSGKDGPRAQISTEMAPAPRFEGVQDPQLPNAQAHRSMATPPRFMTHPDDHLNRTLYPGRSTGVVNGRGADMPDAQVSGSMAPAPRFEGVADDDFPGMQGMRSMFLPPLFAVHPDDVLPVALPPPNPDSRLSALEVGVKFA